MWRLSLDAATVAPIARMVLCGITRCQFTIHSKTGAAAGVEARGYWTIARVVLDSQHARRDFSGDHPCCEHFGDCECNEHRQPGSPQTFAYGEMIWHQLYLERTGGELAARITLSNLPYASDDEPRRDESFDFRFPGIKFDPTRRAFFVSGRGGQTISAARFRGDPFCGWVDLARGAKICLLKKSGRATAILTATDHARAGSQWIETDDNWSLQNLLIALFGQPSPGLP
jgi:hypothetical protein